MENGNGNQQLLSPSPAHDMDRMSAPDGSREHVAARRDRRTVPPSALKKQTWWWPGAAAHSRWQRGSGTTPPTPSTHTDRSGQVQWPRCRRRRTNARDATARPRTWRRGAGHASDPTTCRCGGSPLARRTQRAPPFPDSRLQPAPLERATQTTAEPTRCLCGDYQINRRFVR